MTRGGLRAEIARALGSDTEARWVLDEVLGRGAWDPGTVVPADQRARVDAMVARRLGGEPLQYVLGTWAFRTLELAVDPRALIPRPETEQVVEVALAELRALAPGRPGPVVADLGTGTGAIALSVAAELGPELPGLEVWATDADPGALALAGENLARVAAGHPHVAGRVHLVAGRWLDPLPASRRGRVDLVVSNPPYVSAGEWAGLDPQVRREPACALVAGAGSRGTPGLAAVEAVLRESGRWLARPGVVVIELAPHQAGAAAELARDLGYAGVRVEPDLAGRDRAVVGRLG